MAFKSVDMINHNKVNNETHALYNPHPLYNQKYAMQDTKDRILDAMSLVGVIVLNEEVV